MKQVGRYVVAHKDDAKYELPVVICKVKAILWSICDYVLSNISNRRCVLSDFGGVVSLALNRDHGFKTPTTSPGARLECRWKSRFLCRVLFEFDMCMKILSHGCVAVDTYRRVFIDNIYCNVFIPRSFQGYICRL